MSISGWTGDRGDPVLVRRGGRGANDDRAHTSGRLAHVQISDTNRRAPGWGSLGWADFLGTIEALRYGGWVAVEAEQARVTVPAGVSFNVTNVRSSTTHGDVAINVQNIVLSTATKQLRISLTANAASFTPPGAGATTWSASDVSWNAGPGGGPNQWQNATGSTGTLSAAAYNTVATCNADTSSCSITKLSFTLGAKPTVKRAGSHTLIVTWKFESIGS